MKLKLGYTLVFAGIAFFNLYLVIDQFVGVGMLSMLYWLYLLVIGIVAISIGIILLILGRNLKPESP